MEHIDLALFFKGGPKKVDIMFMDGVATFKTLLDIIKFKQIQDQWFAANPRMNEKKYTDFLLRMFPNCRNQPFIYQTNHQIAYTEAVPVNYSEHEVMPLDYFTMRETDKNHLRAKSKKKAKLSKSTGKKIQSKHKASNYATGQDFRLDTEENSQAFEGQNESLVYERRSQWFDSVMKSGTEGHQEFFDSNGKLHFHRACFW